MVWMFTEFSVGGHAHAGYDESKEPEDIKDEELKIENIPLKATYICPRIRIRKIQFSSIVGKLLFSVDRNLYVEELIHDTTIQFGLCFKSLMLSINGGMIVNFTVEGDEDALVVELAMGAGNQRKNYLRRVRKKIAKLRKTVEIKALGQVEPEAVEDLSIPASSRLLKGSHFHPLAAAVGEERVTNIIPSSVVLTSIGPIVLLVDVDPVNVSVIDLIDSSVDVPVHVPSVNQISHYRRTSEEMTTHGNSVSLAEFIDHNKAETSFNEPRWINGNDIVHIMLVSGNQRMVDHPLRINSVNNTKFARMSVMGIITYYSSWTGQRINKEKSVVIFGKAVPRRKKKLAALLGFKHVEEFTYLAIKIALRRLVASDFHGIMAHAFDRLNAWGSRFLSIAGRVALLKSSFLALPVFLLAYSLVPKDPLRARIAWGFLQNAASLLNRNLITKYGDDLWNGIVKRGSSAAWKILVEGVVFLKQLIRWKISDGNNENVLMAKDQPEMLSKMSGKTITALSFEKSKSIGVGCENKLMWIRSLNLTPEEKLFWGRLWRNALPY
ncbi:hypothetical protein M5K25_024499 [Dendrobium thyrsiflorum]|uniref:Uncharacterized protein n=1 Tax=Dendrobium thyrsiflorum TaxID=117978 RepID=A0ABD0U216_DENTH